MRYQPRNEPCVYIRVQPKKSSLRSGRASAALGRAYTQLAEADAVLKKNQDLGVAFTPAILAAIKKRNAANAEISRFGEAAQAEFTNALAKAAAAPIPDNLNIAGSLSSFEYEEAEGKADKCKIELYNDDARWLDSPAMEKGTIFVASWGYVGDMTPPREVSVQSVKGGSKLTVECLNKGILMHKVAKTRTFSHTTRAEVVKKIAEENGYGSERQVIDEGGGLVGVGAGAAGGSKGKRALDIADIIIAEAGAYASAISLLASTKAAKIKAFAATLESLGFFRSDPIQIGELATLLFGNDLAAQKQNYIAIIISTARAFQSKVRAIPGAGGTRKGVAVRYDRIAQAGETDAQFLRRLANLQGFEFFVDFDGLHWHPRRVGQRPARTLTYYLPPNVGDIVEFPDIDNDISGKAGAVQVKGTNPLTKAAINETSSPATTPRDEPAPVIEIVDKASGTTMLKPAEGSSVVKPTSETSTNAAKSEAKGLFNQTQQTAIEMKLKLIGNPSFVTKSVVFLKGIGKRFSGRYYVHEAKHSLSEKGYEIEAKVKSTGFNSATTPKPADAGTPNTQTPAGNGALSPVEVVNKASGETSVIFKDTRGRA